ncbi:A disintegrin and metalloproteinase with thrombospondin motifs adt-2 isoform X2 [Halyomorpha halys]|uniref:A disintegrin and metalloproteinase with thrombospondin motifs adt-2 isoform X2 n=1 Tax=Halyomorpha halys TaxID=286706 RepID=UPI0034D245E0
MKPGAQPCLPTFTMLLSFLIAFLATYSFARLIQEDMKKFMTDAEWNVYIGPEENEGVELVWHEGRTKGQELDLDFHGERLSINLTLATGLLDPKLVILSRRQNFTELLSPQLAAPSCHFSAPGRAALFLCQGISGIVLSKNDDAYYIINPLRKRLNKRSVDDHIPHIVVKKRLRLAKESFETQRDRRAIGEPNPVHVETAVFIDRDLYTHMKTNFPTETEKEVVKFVLTMVNAVQMLYHDPSLGRRVNFVIKRLEILHIEPTGLVRSHDIDRFLGNFCAWQKGENPEEDSNPLHWDHALILTGLDLYVLSKNGKISKQVVGLAPVAGMCTATSSCTVNEGRHFESVYVVAHEIGHNLGMRHDGPLADNNCDPASYLMSPTLGSGKITWSTCSRQYLKQFLETPQSHCLMDHSAAGEQLDHTSGGLLPGERFSANQQCMLKYGRGSKHSHEQPLADICRDLHCTRDMYTWTSHPALEGTHCGVKKWCRSGRCVSRSASSAIYEPVSGGWSEWGPFSDCASSCLTDENHNLMRGSTGVMVASRLCNDPRPENGGTPCIGSDRKYKTCQPTQCDKVPRTTVRSYAEEVCLRAKEVDNELTGTGFQKISSDPEEACTIWCHKKLGGAKSKGWTFPDGTTCQIYRDQRPLYCISGVCQEFRCSSSTDEIFVIPTHMCSSSLYSRDKRREVAVGIWVPVSDCYYNCISPGSGIRLVEKRPCRYCNTTASVQLCNSSKSCMSLKTPSEEASAVCTKFKQKVRRLSGLGMQLSASVDDPDRPCKLACQDEVMPHRFYLVNGEDGWYPFGTDCSRGDPTRKAFCISGKCLEFGSDNTPLHETVRHFIELHRKKRSGSDFGGATFIDFKNPIFVNTTTVKEHNMNNVLK